MSIESTLARVEADLAAGRRPLARQRLRGLVGTYPERLDLRGRLAETYRADGDAAQAGRWTYLAEDRAAAEVAAFERAYADPIRRMRALGWRAEESEAATEFARTVLRELREEAERAVGAPVSWLDPRAPDPRRSWVAEAFGTFFVAALLVLLALGFFDLLLRGIRLLGQVVRLTGGAR